jgi:antitoxin MazE
MRVSRWGNSLAVRLPRKLVEQLGLAAGDELNVVEASKQHLAVERVDKRAEFLKQLRQLQWPAPEGYKFDRDEANER